jgi:hypothetical protein
MLEPTFGWHALLPWKNARRRARHAAVADARRLTTPTFVRLADAASKSCDAGGYSVDEAIPELRSFPEPTLS